MSSSTALRGWRQRCHWIREGLIRTLIVSRIKSFDWSNFFQNITPIPDISNLRSLTVFVPLAYTDRYEARRTLVSKNTKVDTVDTAICALDCTRRILDTGTRLEEVVIIVNASSMVDDEGVRAAWVRLLRPNVIVRVVGECLEVTRARLVCVRVQPAEGREAFYEL